MVATIAVAALRSEAASTPPAATEEKLVRKGRLTAVGNTTLNATARLFIAGPTGLLAVASTSKRPVSLIAHRQLRPNKVGVAIAEVQIVRRL